MQESDFMNTALAKETPAQAAVKGLKGVIAADSAICLVDGLEGRLIYRGYDIHELADHSNYEEVCHLLLKGELPDERELKEFTARLAGYRRLPRELVAFLKS